MKPRQSPEDLTALLARVPLLEGVNEATLRGAAEVLVLRQVSKKESVMLKGTAGEHLMFLLSGRLQVFDVTEGGREIGLNLLGPGDYFGEISIIDGRPRSASVIAIEASTIALLPKLQALQLFHQNALVAERVLKGLANKLRNASVFQTILCLPNASQRVFALLRHMSSTVGGGLTVVEHPPKQQELAIMANTSRETVSRAIKVLTDKRIVEKDNHRLIVRQPAQLEALTYRDAGSDHRTPG